MARTSDAFFERAPLLLGREELAGSFASAARLFEGERILITGAGGSVGPAVAEAILETAAERLLLLDHHEASLFELHRRYGNQADRVALVLADVRNRQRMAAIFAEWRPGVVFHLAAYKHVPFGEAFSNETFAVNVLGTRLLLQLAREHDVRRFVYPSSDKSCDPPSVYGATKRISEVLVRRAADGGERVYNVARFVNILGTQGSVVETFVQQIQEGKPLTVTDRQMSRYWISMKEAVWLLLSAATQQSGAQTLMVDARDEISVVDMARRVSHLLRQDQPPGEILFGSPRPGERLREVLLSASESFVPGPESGLLRVVDQRSREHVGIVETLLAQLTGLAEAGDTGALRQAMMAAARALQ
jgi:FlaA1/EpsC-like NDP-sugar epimerase